MAILGIIALSGMIIRNSIILLDQIEIHKAEGQEPREAIINSATLRFRPIIYRYRGDFRHDSSHGIHRHRPIGHHFSGGLLSSNGSNTHRITCHVMQAGIR